MPEGLFKTDYNNIEKMIGICCQIIKGKGTMDDMILVYAIFAYFLIIIMNGMFSKHFLSRKDQVLHYLRQQKA